MPVFRNRTVFSVVKDIKAFLNLEAGITRSGLPELGQDNLARLRKQIDEIRQQLKSKEQELAELQAEVTGNSIGAETNGVRPGNIVWIFGFGRSGSTWLSSMMGELENHVVWDEPLIGELFGSFYYTGVTSYSAINEREEFVLGPGREVRSGLVRSFFLGRADAGFPRVAGDNTLVVKEPNGSIGAPLLMEALPESRMILLIRDPRDVMASFIDGQRKEGWGRTFLEEDIPEFDAEAWGSIYRQHIGKARQAYRTHKGRKVLIKYEDLLANTLGTMKHIYSALEIPVDEKEMTRVVERHSWKNIPEDQKGQGRFYRKATPGGWREDLSTDQIQTVEKICAPIIDKFYSHADKR